MKIINLTFILLVITVLGQSCTKAIIDYTESTVIPKEVNFDQNIEAVVTNYCTTCHAGNSPADGIDLTSYDMVKHYSENGNLIERLNDASNPMPPNGMLSPNDRLLFDYWRNNQYPEN